MQYFEKITLQDLGLVIQLGHPPRQRCVAPAIAPRACLVLHTNGLHPVTLQFCECDQVARAGDRTQQLLRAELYGATLADPTSLMTFDMLRHYHLLTTQSKINMYDFYRTLEKITDVSGLGPSYVSVSRSIIGRR